MPGLEDTSRAHRKSRGHQSASVRPPSVLRNIPVRPEVFGRNCVAWVKEALESVIRDGGALGTAIKEWESTRDTAMWYVAKKRAEHRFDWGVEHATSKAAIPDTLDGKESIL
ncbi:hypothetical protein DL769_011237 [Monosporascus sp. CRB-8-3]|nr:hypothetical protein DL769_011237 [Monosporascus sp. CRB-8-3]